MVRSADLPHTNEYYAILHGSNLRFYMLACLQFTGFGSGRNQHKTSEDEDKRETHPTSNIICFRYRFRNKKNRDIRCGRLYGSVQANGRIVVVRLAGPASSGEAKERRHDRVRSWMRSNLIGARAGRLNCGLPYSGRRTVVLHFPPPLVVDSPTNITLWPPTDRHRVPHSILELQEPFDIATQHDGKERPCPTPTPSPRSRRSTSSFRSSTKALRASSSFPVPTIRAGGSD